MESSGGYSSNPALSSTAVGSGFFSIGSRFRNSRFFLSASQTNYFNVSENNLTYLKARINAFDFRFSTWTGITASDPYIGLGIERRFGILKSEIQALRYWKTQKSDVGAIVGIENDFEFLDGASVITPLLELKANLSSQTNQSYLQPGLGVEVLQEWWEGDEGALLSSTLITEVQIRSYRSGTLPARQGGRRPKKSESGTSSSTNSTASSTSPSGSSAAVAERLATASVSLDYEWSRSFGVSLHFTAQKGESDTREGRAYLSARYRY